MADGPIEVKRGVGNTDALGRERPSIGEALDPGPTTSTIRM
jgi:hypothetical protein